MTTSLGLLTEAILERDQPRTTDVFFRMVKREGISLGEALDVVTRAEAPFVQVPNHVDVRDGQITLINNDHTILGLRTSADLVQYLPEEYRLLGMLQSVWYIPAGLDIWNQLRGKYPGRYATMKGINVPPPSYGPVVWNDDQQPIVEVGGFEDRLHAHMIATMSGDVKRSYGLFLGLAADEAVRPKLRDQMLFLGLIDLQDTVMGRKARNTGHKALRARAVVDLAEHIGWERAHGVYYTGVPDMAIGPLYYSLYDAACVTMTEAFPDAGKSLKQTNQSKLTAEQVEDMVRLLMEAMRRRCGTRSPRICATASRCAAWATPSSLARRNWYCAPPSRASSPMASIRSTTATPRTTGCGLRTIRISRASCI